MNLIYQNYHKHTCDSNIMTPDSAATIEDYAKRCVELGHKVLSSVEHGWQGQYFKVYEIAKKYGLKFIFGTEAYWVLNRLEKDDTNAHIVILAKNENGRREINEILSEANLTGYYKKPRIDLELMLSLNPQNVFITSACVAFWKFGNMEEIICKLHNHFKENFMLEIQYHNTPMQINLNRKIKQLAYKYGIKMIMGADSHYIYPEQAEDREIILDAKNIHYEDEDGWYLDYPDGETAFQRIKNQDIFTYDEIKEIINNTNIILNFEDIEFNNDIKLPTLYPELSQEEKDQIYDKLLVQEWNKIKQTIPKEKHKEYIEEIKKEAKVVRNTKMADYFILDYHIVEDAKKMGGIITYTGRGSGSSYYTNTLLGFSNIDRIASPVKLYPERFMSETRILETRSLPDLDLNLGTPEIFAEAQTKLLGEGHSYPMIAFGTFKIKSSFKMYARSQKLDFELANEVTRQLEKYENDLKNADEDEKDMINVYDYVDEKYHEYLRGSEKYQGIVSDKKPHPCAYLVYQGDIRSELGLMKIKSKQSKKETIVTVVDGYVAEKYKFLKNDLLKVDVVNTIHKTYEKIGMKQHTINELMEITKSDNKVWQIYEKGLTLGVNQVEKPSTTHKVMRYKPKNISELTAFIAAIRPSFKSMYNIFEKRQPFSYGIKAFDKIIQTEELPYSFVLYQEQMMNTLQYAGFPPDETYGIIKAISKKKPEIVFPLKQRFIDGFSTKILEEEKHLTKENAKEKSDKVWKIIEDSSNYGFNSSHAYSYAFDSLYGAYLKAHYPYEFYSVMLNTYTEKGEKEKVSAFKKEMFEGFGIKTGELKFGLDNREFTVDKDNQAIHPNMSAIKFLNGTVAEELYEIGKNKYNSFADLLFKLHNDSGCTLKQIKILIILNYFKDFGKNQKLLTILEQFEKRLKNKNLKEETKQTRLQEIRDYENGTKDIAINIKDQLKGEIEYLGQETTTIEKSPENVYIVTCIDTKYTPKLRLYCLKNGKILEVKCRKNDMKKNQFGEFNIIQVKNLTERKKKRKVDDKWIELDDTELYLTGWDVLK